MKTIFRVAKTELRTLFYAPIAWFLMIVFLVQCSIVYLGMLDGIARQQELGGQGLMYLGDLTERIFLSRQGLFGNVTQNLYLYIPLLTMSLISRETSSGTIKLLYSSPIRVREIVLGKYLSMMVYSLILVAIVGIFVVSGTIQVQNADTGMLMTAMLGFYLLLCAYSAIGLFMSCLTTYQVVAAICTFVMIGILSFIGSVWQRVEFVRELTYFLSINGRTQKMVAGLVTTKDVIYFVVIVYIFLGLSIYKLKAGMESKPASVKAMRYIVIVASALLIGYVSSIPSLIGYYDATANKTRTLTPNAQKILAELGDEPLEITAYSNLLSRHWYLGSPESYNDNLARWEPYMRFKHNIQLKTVRYYDSAFDNPYMFTSYPGKSLQEIAAQYGKTNDIKLKGILTPEQIRKQIDLKPEMNRYVMQLKWKGRTTFLRVFDDNTVWPGETEVSAAFKRLLQSKLPKIGFLTGDLERDVDKLGDRDYKALTNLSTFRNSLVNQGFDVDSLTLETQDVPADIATLVIADPKMEFSTVTMARLQQYVNNGGNLLICGEPGKQSLLNPLLQQLGVKLMDGTLIQESKEFAPNLVLPDVTKFAASFFEPLKRKVADSTKVSMPGAAGLSYTTDGAFNIRPLLVTNGRLTWNRIKPLDLDMMISAQADASNRNMMVQGGGVIATSMPAAAVPEEKKRKTVAAEPSVEERKKRADSIRAAIQNIMNGAGTMEEKQEKVSAMMNKIGKPVVLSAEKKKTLDSIQAVMNDIGNGDGTMEEKQQKAAAVMAAIEKQQAVGKVVPKKIIAPGSKRAVVAETQTATRADKNATAGTVTFSAEDGDVKGPIPAALSLTRSINGKEQRIVITGDADFMSNAELQRFNVQTANFLFNTALFSWLCNGEFPIDTSRPDGKDKRVNVTMDDVDLLRIIYTWLMPGVLLAFGAVLLIRRKRK